MTEPLYSYETRSNFTQRIFVMYHGTTASNASNILKYGFKPSNASINMLGSGIYVSADFGKAQRYGDVVLKCLVYPGKVAKITRQNHPWQKSWQEDFSSAWVPPNCGMVDSNLQENCVKSAKQIKILGISKGFRYLGYDCRRLARDLVNYDNTPTDDDLEEFKTQLGIGESVLLYNITEGKYFGYSNNGNLTGYDNVDNVNHNGILWNFSWDRLLENDSRGILDITGRQRAVTWDYEPDCNYTKWKLDNQGYLVNLKNSGCLTAYSENKHYYFVCENRHRGDIWQFRSNKLIYSDSDSEYSTDYSDYYF